MTMTVDSKLIVPSYIAAELREKELKDKAETIEKVDESAPKGSLLPRPCGYNILCAVPEVEKTYGGLLAKADSTVRVEEHTTVVLFVMDLGPEAYKDKTRFPDGPWCKKGDFVITRAYQGTRIKIFGKEFRLLKDDQIEAVVDDPRGIQRV